MVQVNGDFSIYEVVGIGLYFVIIGYEFLLFGYFLLFRYRRSKRVYWLFMGSFFIFLVISRVGYLFYDYFFSKTDTVDQMAAWKFANAFGWVAVSMVSEILSILLFTSESKAHQVMKRVFPLVPIAIAVIIIFLPPSSVTNPAGPAWGILGSLPIAKIVFNIMILPAYIVLLPFMFFYLAAKSAGTLQRSFLFNGIGLLFYYAVRAAQPLLVPNPAEVTSFTAAALPVLLLILAILIITFANQYETLK
jgi:hypothetical protein